MLFGYLLIKDKMILKKQGYEKRYPQGAGKGICCTPQLF